MYEIDTEFIDHSCIPQRDNYHLVDTCHIMYEQTQALLESAENWLDYLKSPEEQVNYHPSINPISELEEGLFRFIQAIKKEAYFLKGLIQNEERIEPHHVTGSNFPFLEAVYHCARREKGLVTIFKPVRFVSPKILDSMEETATTTWEKLRIDVVGHDGLKWIKVSARNARGLLGQELSINYEASENEVIPLQNKARLMQLAAAQNQIHFKAPRICFQFSCFNDNKPHLELAVESIFRTLSDLGVLIEEVPILSPPGLLPGGEWRYDLTRVTTPSLNLDITTLLALCSQLTHYGSSCSLKTGPNGANESLRIQLEQEKITPILPFLVHLIHNRSLYTTQACYDKFLKITSTIAGPTEQFRANILFRHHQQNLPLIKKDLAYSEDDPFKNWKELTGCSISPSIQVLPNDPSEKLQEIFDKGIYKGFKELHLLTFGPGHKLKMSCVTANSAVARSLINSAPALGPSLAFPDNDFFIIHEPRSFVENKLLIS